jgi:hypothetical protein
VLPQSGRAAAYALLASEQEMNTWTGNPTCRIKHAGVERTQRASRLLVQRYVPALGYLVCLQIETCERSETREKEGRSGSC